MPARPGPGPIAVVHRVLIVTALGGALAYTLWELREAMHGDGVLGGVRVGLGLAVCVGIAVYLRSLRGLGAKLTPRE